MVTNDDGRARATQVGGRIALCATRCDGVPEYFSALGANTMRCFVFPAFLDPPQGCEQLRCCNRCDGQLAEVGEGECFETAELFLVGAWAEALRFQVQVFPRDCLERVGARGLLGLSLRGRILGSTFAAISRRASSRRSRAVLRDTSGTGSEADQLLAPVHSVPHPPQPSAGRRLCNRYDTSGLTTRPDRLQRGTRGSLIKSRSRGWP